MRSDLIEARAENRIGGIIIPGSFSAADRARVLTEVLAEHTETVGVDVHVRGFSIQFEKFTADAPTPIYDVHMLGDDVVFWKSEG